MTQDSRRSNRTPRTARRARSRALAIDPSGSAASIETNTWSAFHQHEPARLRASCTAWIKTACHASAASNPWESAWLAETADASPTARISVPCGAERNLTVAGIRISFPSEEATRTSCSVTTIEYFCPEQRATARSTRAGSRPEAIARSDATQVGIQLAELGLSKSCAGSTSPGGTQPRRGHARQWPFAGAHSPEASGSERRRTHPTPTQRRTGWQGD